VKHSEAARLVAVLSAYWPGTDIREETAQLWERELVGFEIEDGMDAARQLGRSGRFMPSLGEFSDAIIECRNERLVRERAARALPPGQDTSCCTFGEFLRDRPDMRVRVKRLGLEAMVSRIESEDRG